jgi:hypothetical protein
MIIPAQPGFELLYLSSSEPSGFTRDPVLAWEYSDEHPCWPPLAHTDSMREYFPDFCHAPWYAFFGVLHPDGRVYVHVPGKERNPCNPAKYYPSIDAWLAAEREPCEALRREAAAMCRDYDAALAEEIAEIEKRRQEWRLAYPDVAREDDRWREGRES